jgi:hypothetical protein
MTKKEQLKLHNPVLMLSGFDIIDALFPDAKYKEMIVNLIKGRFNNNKISKDEVKHYYGDSVNHILEKYSDFEVSYIFRVLDYMLNDNQVKMLKTFINHDKQNLMNGVDYTSIKNFEDIEKLNSLSEIKKMGNELEKEIIKIYEDKEWLLLRPLTHLSSMKYGSSTKWCTTSEYEPSYFSRYSKNGALIYCINKMTGLKVASHRDYSEPSTTFWNMQDNRIDSLDTGLPYSILDIVRSEILKNKTNHDLMSEEQINKEALYLLRFEYGEKMSLGIEVTQRVRDINLDLDLPMTEPTIDPTPEPTININRNAMIGRLMAG